MLKGKVNTLKIEVGGFIKTSVCDGIGLRSVVFLQGCHVGCVGCHNPSLHPVGQGREFSIDALILLIETHAKNKKLTISGGEPLEQKMALTVLLQKLQEMGYDLCLYTSREKEKVPPEILDTLSSLKTGKYVEGLSGGKTPFAGSGNQQFWGKITDEKGVVTWYEVLTT